MPTTVAANAPESAPALPRPRRWRRRLLIAGVLLALVAVFHATLLRWLAAGLVLDDAPAAADAFVIAGSYGPFAPVPLDELARLCHDHPGARIVLIEDRSSRLARLDIVPTLDSVVRRELAKRDVSADSVTTLTVTSSGDGEGARSLQTWLRQNPDAQVTILCDQFSSRRTARGFRRILSAEASQRVHWRALPDRRFDVDTWWHERQGVVTVLGEYIALGFVALHGEDEATPAWDLDQYEKTLTDPGAR